MGAYQSVSEGGAYKRGVHVFLLLYLPSRIIGGWRLHNDAKAGI
jgi:hypothetical protein